MNIHETAVEPLYQGMNKTIGPIAQAYLTLCGGGPTPTVEFQCYLAFNVIFDDDDWAIDCWVSSEDDIEANLFGFYHHFADRQEYISSLGKTEFLLRLEIKQWIKEEFTIVDKYGDPVSEDRADFIVRSAK